jgi:hypothetical protein
MAVVPDSLRASRYNWGEESVAYLSQLAETPRSSVSALRRRCKVSPDASFQRKEGRKRRQNVPDSLRASRYNWGEESVAYLSQLGFKDVDFRTYSLNGVVRGTVTPKDGDLCRMVRLHLRWEVLVNSPVSDSRRGWLSFLTLCARPDTTGEKRASPTCPSSGSSIQCVSPASPVQGQSRRQLPTQRGT